MRNITFGLCLFIALLGSVNKASAYDTCAQYGFTCTWPRYSEGDFPARVSALVFPNGGVLDNTRSVRLGQWTVSFGSNVGAFYETRMEGARDSWNYIHIRGLACRNPLVAEFPCSMTLISVTAGARYCELDSDDLNRYSAGVSGQHQLLWSQRANICPSDLQLRQ